MTMSQLAAQLIKIKIGQKTEMQASVKLSATITRESSKRINVGFYEHCYYTNVIQPAAGVDGSN